MGGVSDKEQTTAIVGRLERERERGRAGRRVLERDGGLFSNMLFVTEAAQREEGGIWQNAGKTGFSEQNPRQPGEGRSDCVITCARSVACVPTSYTCIRQKLYAVYFLSSLKSCCCY